MFDGSGGSYRPTLPPCCKHQNRHCHWKTPTASCHTHARIPCHSTTASMAHLLQHNHACRSMPWVLEDNAQLRTSNVMRQGVLHIGNKCPVTLLIPATVDDSFYSLDGICSCILACSAMTLPSQVVEGLGRWQLGTASNVCSSRSNQGSRSCHQQ